MNHRLGHCAGIYSYNIHWRMYTCRKAQITSTNSDKIFRKNRSYASIEMTTSAKRMISYERPSKSIRNIPPELLIKTAEILGKGRFASCFKAYLQGTSVCIKENDQMLRSRATSAVSKEANILSQLSHPAVCFLIGIQAQQTPYCLVINLYEVRGYSITIHDLLFSDSIINSSKMQLTQSLHTEFDVDMWFHITLQIAEGLEYLHQKNIVHRDLKTDNIAIFEQNNKFFPVIIDFGKSEFGSATKKYNLAKEAKQEYRTIHRHIAPDLVDGIVKPSTSSDIYSYGRIFKSIICYFPLSRELIPHSIVDMVNKCLSYQASQRPSASCVISTLRAGL